MFDKENNAKAKENFQQQQKKKIQALTKQIRAKEYNWTENTVEGVNGQLHEVKEMISKLRDRKSEEQKGKKGVRKSEHSLRNLWDTTKWNNTHTIGIPEREKREKKEERLF